MTLSFAYTTELVRISRFGAVGLLNTALDFGVFNALSSKAIGLTKLQANTISTTIAMAISFWLNKTAVFQAGGNAWHQAASFFVVTALGLYVLQNGVIYLLAQRWTWPRRLVRQLIRNLKLEEASTEFWLKNGAKAVGTIVSLTWNYLLYKRLVFQS